MLEDIDVILLCFVFIEKWLQDSQLNVKYLPPDFSFDAEKSEVHDVDCSRGEILHRPDGLSLCSRLLVRCDSN